jgi:Tfp pilus assembly protein PilO
MNRSSTVAVIFLLSLIFGIFLVRPKYQELKLKRVEVYQKEIELRNLKDHEAEIRLISEELKKYSEELAKIDSALPSRFSLLSLLNYLQKTTSENGLIFKNYSFSTLSPKEAGIKEFSLAMNISGSYNSFKNFLSILEKSSRLFEIEKISFSSPEKEKPLDFTIGIKFYSY